MNLYKRHVEGCQYRKKAGKDKNRSHRCSCSIYIETNSEGKQKRERVKDPAMQPVSSWTQAEELAKRNADETGNPAQPAPRGKSTTTVDEAVESFLKNKEGASLDPVTIGKHRLTLTRLQAYCAAEGITLLADLDLPKLSDWRTTWTEKSPVARRNNQGRVRAFFRYCVTAKFIPSSPAADLERIKVKKDEAENVRPLTSKEFERLIKSVDHVKSMTPINTQRVACMMKLQRYSGLALVDAVMLSKENLIKEGSMYRVTLGRRKTGTQVNNVIPTWLAEELLTVKNGSPQYFFQTGSATPKSAVSVYDKLYRQTFAQAGIKTDDGLSHRFRHTYAVGLLTAGVDIRTVSKALGHESVTITEKFYSKWNKAQQARHDDEILRGLGKMPS